VVTWTGRESCSLRRCRRSMATAQAVIFRRLNRPGGRLGRSPKRCRTANPRGPGRFTQISPARRHQRHAAASMGWRASRRASHHFSAWPFRVGCGGAAHLRPGEDRHQEMEFLVSRGLVKASGARTISRRPPPSCRAPRAASPHQRLLRALAGQSTLPPGEFPTVPPIDLPAGPRAKISTRPRRSDQGDRPRPARAAPGPRSGGGTARDTHRPNRALQEARLNNDSLPLMSSAVRQVRKRFHTVARPPARMPRVECRSPRRCP